MLSAVFKRLKHFFAKIESKLITFDSEKSTELRRAAVKHCDFSFLLVQQLFENFIPIRSAGVGSGFQTRDEIAFFLK